MKEKRDNCTIEGCGGDLYGHIKRKPYCRHHFNKFVVTQPLVREQKKTGRNETCPCGSGKKYKNCCIKNEPRSEHYFKNRQNVVS